VRILKSHPPTDKLITAYDQLEAGEGCDNEDSIEVDLMHLRLIFLIIIYIYFRDCSLGRFCMTA